MMAKLTKQERRTRIVVVFIALLFIGTSLAVLFTTV